MFDKVPILKFFKSIYEIDRTLIFGMTKLQEKIDAWDKWVRPEVPEFIEYDEQIGDLIDGKNVSWDKMAVEEVENIPAMGALANIPVEGSKEE